MGNHVTRNDFEWTSKEQTHLKRRKEMLKKYPQIKKLFGVDPTFKWKALALVLLQFAMMKVMSTSSWPFLFLAAYTVGGVVNNALMVALHEIGHGGGFGVQHPIANYLFGIFANLPLGMPIFVSYKRYHSDHHKSLGVDVLDTDLPSDLEARMFCTTFGKMVWIFLHPCFLFLRPFFVYPRAPIMMEYVNWVAQLAFNAAVYYSFGAKVLLYLVGATLISVGFHPLVGQFITGHVMFKKGIDTNSYYGPLNWVTFNIGYHNEHHDFPYIPASRLPEVRRIAPEFYDALPCYNSWLRATYDFVFNPSLGLYSRVKRTNAKNVPAQMRS